ncbi:MAG: hypothetical protein EPO38_01310 [Rhizorhabdus sp.]|jgi:hypothetical protein|nr:MAG: hypothetical protein EPO38_01310 [Rhizorhabdus sp.]
MLHTRDLNGVVEVDGEQYEWSLQREPQWCTVDGWKGMAVSLRHRDAGREALLEFPMPSSRRSKLQPQLRRPQINQRIIENGVRAALAAGWNPASRGKPITFEVDANGC